MCDVARVGGAPVRGSRRVMHVVRSPVFATDPMYVCMHTYIRMCVCVCVCVCVY